jgi:hypothetical protein
MGSEVVQVVERERTGCQGVDRQSLRVARGKGTWARAEGVRPDRKKVTKVKRRWVEIAPGREG